MAAQELILIPEGGSAAIIVEGQSKGPLGVKKRGDLNDFQTRKIAARKRILFITAIKPRNRGMHRLDVAH